MKLITLHESIITLRHELEALRPQLAQAAQVVYDEWGQDDEFIGGICEDISSAMLGIIADNIDANIREWGHDGDEHAAVIVSRANEQYVVDIPYDMYEQRISHYNWRKHPDTTFKPEDVIIEPI